MTQLPRYDGSFARSTNFALFSAIWQPDAALFWRVKREDQAPRFEPWQSIVSVFGGQYWIISGRNYIETCRAPNGSLDNPIALSATIRLLTLDEVLQGGVMHVRPGDINWTGNTFVARVPPSPVDSRFTVRGTLMVKSGRPAQLLVDYSTGRTSADLTARWRIRYLYDKPLAAAFFPSAIRGFAIMEGREVEMLEYTVLRLKMAERPQPMAVFDPGPALALHPMPTLFFTDGAMYAMTPGGAPVEIERHPAWGERPALSRETRRVVTLVALAGVSLCFLAFFWRAGAIERTTTMKQRTGVKL